MVCLSISVAGLLWISSSYEQNKLVGINSTVSRAEPIQSCVEGLCLWRQLVLVEPKGLLLLHYSQDVSRYFPAEKKKKAKPPNKILHFLFYPSLPTLTLIKPTGSHKELDNPVLTLRYWIFTCVLDLWEKKCHILCLTKITSYFQITKCLE